jgi:predicted porin
MMHRILLAGAAVAALVGTPVQAKDDKDDSLTFAGVTLYGLIDVNATYQTHGEKVSGSFPVGTEYLIIGSKNAGGGHFNLSENGRSASKIGIRGSEKIGGEWTAVFKAETEFLPLSGQLVNGLKSMVAANGVPLAQQTTAYGDTNKAGQAFNGNLYAGVSHPQYGTLTFGRQPSMMWDDLIRYDPLHGAYAFSLLGYAGGLPGGGSTENRYTNNSLRYQIRHGAAHAGVMVGLGDGTAAGRSLEFDAGADVGRFSIDALYKVTHNAVNASPLTTNATGTLSASQSAAMSAFGLSMGNTLAASITDNRAFLVNGMVDLGRVKLLAGYEHITYNNPDTALTQAGLVDGLGWATTIGGYDILTNSASLPREKVVQVAWGGTRLAITRAWELDAAGYIEMQNNFSTSPTLAGCSSAALSAQCSGHFYSASLMSEYHINRHFGIYAGAMWSKVAGGMANGYQHSGTVDPTLGAQITF